MPYRLDTTPAYADLPEQISVKVVAAYLGVSPKAIYQQIMRGSLPATKVGAHYPGRPRRSCRAGDRGGQEGLEPAGVR